MYDSVTVYFNDGTITMIWVDEDDSIPDAIITLCEDEGCDIIDVDGYSIRGITEGPITVEAYWDKVSL